MAKKEDVVAIAEKLMDNQQNIRNMGIVAHIDHGKCVSGESKLAITDGSVIEAKKLYAMARKQGKIVKNNENETVIDIADKNILTYSLNKHNGRVEIKPISHAWKLKGGKVIRVGLRNGYNIKTTPEHRYVILENMEFVEKEAKEVKIGDRVVCLKKLPKQQEEIISTSNSTNVIQKQKIDLKEVEKVIEAGVVGVEVKSIEESFEENVYDFTVPDNHNFVAEGVFIHNTTLTDSLVAAAGLISQELAGQVQFMDYEDQEKERGITINAANIALSHHYKDADYLINLIDTPGHVDFGGEVIRAMRAVDGVILVVDSVEGVMPQTETVIRQALRENVKPILFINKVDRLINELQLTQEQMQERFVKTIVQVNKLIAANAPEEFKDKWLVKVENGSVGFGSAYQKWAVTTGTMKSSGISFKDVFDYCKKEDQKTLAQKSPLHLAVFEMIINHLPNPIEAQKYRIPKIWKGEPESEVGKSMIGCNMKGKAVMMITDVSVDPHAGDIATGRVYSGIIKKGTNVRLLGLQKEVAVTKVGVFMGQDFVNIEKIPAGNIGAIVGLKEVYAGETVSEGEVRKFEEFMSNAEPVVTISVEAKSTKDLPKLIEVIRQITKEDPNIVASINQETGEHLLSGMGELHLEITQYRIEKHHKVPITVSQPIVVYHETMTREGPSVESKTPNKHNKFLLHAEPLPKAVREKLIDEKISGKVRPKDKELVDKFIEIGFERDEAKKIWAVNNHCVLVDATRGIVALHEIKELVMQAFNDATNEGPLAKEKCDSVKIVLEDATLHEDAIHRGPSQVLPAMTRGIYAAMLSGDAILLEPKQTLTITVPESYMGATTKQLGSRRTQIRDMRTEGDSAIIIGTAPVKELIGFSQSIRSATQGRAVWTGEYAGYEPLPRELQKQVIKEVRTRKGMDPEPKSASFFLE